jgi:hypothetical protein
MPYTEQSLPFQSGSQSSYRGAQHAARRRGEKLMLLLGAYVTAGSNGLTGHEAVARTGLPMQSICSLRAALKDANEIRPCGQRMGAYGVPVDVHVVTEAGVLAHRSAA